MAQRDGRLMSAISISSFPNAPDERSQHHPMTRGPSTRMALWHWAPPPILPLPFPSLLTISHSPVNDGRNPTIQFHASWHSVGGFATDSSQPRLAGHWATGPLSARSGIWRLERTALSQKPGTGSVEDVGADIGTTRELGRGEGGETGALLATTGKAGEPGVPVGFRPSD